ncbi:MAG: ABC transporter ATP-binding protein [Actinobacteria bacterium]|nr:ABC transporter ATP-binding protein [Actinomycetota bacterium]
MTAGDPVLEVRDLCVTFATDDGPLKAVDRLSYTLHRGQSLAVVGESGSGKSVSSLAVLGLVPGRGATITGSVRFDGVELLGASERTLQEVRGKGIAMVFQDALTSLNPVLRVGNQIAEAIAVHRPRAERDRSELSRRVVELLDLVGIPDPASRAELYPHELSGGQRQRAMIAMALANDPAVLLADEPTTALDVTIQAQVLDVFERIQERTDTALLLITHDLGVVAGVADEVLVMYAGRRVEQAGAEALYADPGHPYTRGLMDSLPRLDRPRGSKLGRIPGQPPALTHLPVGCAFAPRCGSFRPGVCDQQEIETVEVRPGHLVACVRADELDGDPPPLADTIARSSIRVIDAAPLVRVSGLVKEFPVRGSRQLVHAVSDVSFEVPAGTTLGVVGESGCGKSTLARLLLRLIEATDGVIEIDSMDVGALSSRELRRFRGVAQMVFQDPYASLNPRLTVHSIVGEPLMLAGAHRHAIDQRVAELLGMVGLDPRFANRYPHEFSGGQRQRIGIARALARDPRLVVLDEPVSALDVSIQAGVVNLLTDLQEQLGLTYVFIAHDLAVVRHISDAVAVMYLGHIVEHAPSEVLYEDPAHPYTQALLSANNIPDPVVERARRRIILEGDVPSPINPPSGCVFHTRCPIAGPRCSEEVPALVEHAPGHLVACHHPGPLPVTITRR